MTNIHFAIEDINRIRLPGNTYDVVLMSMALHHVRNLEYLLAQVAHTLKPHGYFIANEYVGPSQFQYGGTILHPLLEHIVGNFSAESDRDVAIIRLLALFEDILIENRVLTSDFAVLVAQKPASGKTFLRLDWERIATGTRKILTAFPSRWSRNG